MSRSSDPVASAGSTNRGGDRSPVNPHLIAALAIALVGHGALLFHTFKRTYDAYVHIFFADHYARAWFDHWEYRWYTGFTMTSYPPGSQQSIALVSPLIGLQNGFILIQMMAFLWVIVGIYRFSRLWVSEEAAGYAALLAVFASSIVETIHVFGQLPTTFSLGFLLNALPFVYRWLITGRWRLLGMAWLLNAATTAGHHVTTLFGAVFFVGPVIVLALVEQWRSPLPDEPWPSHARLTRDTWRPIVVRRLRRVIPTLLRTGLYGVGLILVLLAVVLPYWLWSHSDPIVQVPIPHASRDSFIENTAAGLVFWVIPYGVGLVTLPYVFLRGLSGRAWPLTLSILLLFVLGTGGTTPIPRLLLGGAFEILTLDRFTFWATILVLPLQGEFVRSLRHGRIAATLREQLGVAPWRLTQGGLLVAYLVFAIFVANITQFRRFQPEPIDMTPIVAFIEKDEHWRWRYLALGFGDQLAWLSAQTTATTVDGNYHSARRLPELTSTPVERLEGAKFRGMPGIGSLQQFLAVPDKYHLKFVFSNDTFYDPLLFFSGWHRVQRLENGIMVWEREDIAPLPEVLPRKEIPIFLRLMWGSVPISMLVLGSVAFSLYAVGVRVPDLPGTRTLHARGRWLWERVDRRLRAQSVLETPIEEGSEHPWQLWHAWLARVRPPLPPPPARRRARALMVGLVLVGALALAADHFRRVDQGPIRVVEAYYDDLDFRRFRDAYERLDPLTRPTYDQYLLDLSVQGGLLASYAKLDSVTARALRVEPNFVEVEVEALWVTALSAYPHRSRHRLHRRDGAWRLEPERIDGEIPPDQFFSRGSVSFASLGRRRATTETTSFGDVLDRPELQIISAQLVRRDGRYSVVGELVNLDVDPGDVTVTALLLDEQGDILSRYNAQQLIIHKLLPKETTPFRVDFEGVAGARLLGVDPGEFDPDDFTPLELDAPIAFWEVYAKAVVTGRDLYRGLAVQSLAVEERDGEWVVRGELINHGTVEALIPHLLITLYAEDGSVHWVDQLYLEQSVRPQRSRPFTVPLPAVSEIERVDARGQHFTNALRDRQLVGLQDGSTIPLDPASGFGALRLDVHTFTEGAP